MVAYLAIQDAAGGGEAWAGLRAALAADPHWRAVVDQSDALVAVRGPPWPALHQLPAGRGWLVGDVHRTSFGRVADPLESVRLSQVLGSAETAKTLCADYWGRYVALILSPDRSALSVYRDPSGAVDALTWRGGTATVVASHLPAWLPRPFWPDLSIDWTVLARWLASPSLAAVTSGLAGVRSVTPGAFRQEDEEVLIWRPAEIACRAPPSDVGARLPQVLDAVTGALLAGEDRLLVEISGGLDSAIVASAVAPVARDRVAAWLNTYTAEAPGDERAYARQVAAFWGLPLTEVETPPFRFEAADLALAADGLRPGFGAMDTWRDQELARRFADLGVTRAVTGQGGDMVFYQIPTPTLAVDLLRRRGLRAGLGGTLAGYGRWMGKSVWALALGALDPRATWPGEASVADHPWMAEAGRLPPAKRAQVAILAQKLLVQVEKVRGRRTEMIHPLLTQPMLELCLSIPAPDLTLGGRDRGLARAAFADRLPPAIRDRRGKGALTGYYGKVVGASLPFLREHLLEGRLVQAGLLDRAALEAGMTPEALVWRGDYFTLVLAAALESWVRCWQARAAGSSGTSPAPG